MQSWCVFKYISQKGILCLVLLESLIQRESKLLLPTSKAFSEIYCEFYDKYYIRKHLVTTCQLGDCAQLEKLTMMRPTVGQSGGEEVDKSWWKLRNWKIEVIQRIKLNEMYNSINQAFSSYYKMRSILNRKDFMTTVVLKFVTCIDLGISQWWLLICVWIKNQSLIMLKDATLMTRDNLYCC